jgi:urease accessory protein
VSLQAVVAHLVTTGVGPFYDGAAHFFMSPDEILPVLTLSLLAGMRGPRPSRWMLLILPAAWVAGGVFGLGRPMVVPPTMLTMALAGVPAVLLAWDRELALPVVPAMAALFGLWIGFLNGAAMTAAGVGMRGLLGATAAALVTITLTAALAASIRPGWPRVVVRVIGSWMAALALLALGWTLRG